MGRAAGESILDSESVWGVLSFRRAQSVVSAVLIMRERQLGIVKRAPTGTIGACEHCNTQFGSSHPSPDYAEKEIQAAFDAHRCERPDGGQNATTERGRTNPNVTERNAQIS